MTLDELLDRLRQYKNDEDVWVVNLQREIQLRQTYKAIQEIVLKEDPDAVISCEMHEINDGSAVIEVVTDWLEVKEIEKFCESISNVNNFEIYPLNNGKIQFNMMFNGVRQRVY